MLSYGRFAKIYLEKSIIWPRGSYLNYNFRFKNRHHVFEVPHTKMFSTFVKIRPNVQNQNSTNFNFVWRTLFSKYAKNNWTVTAYKEGYYLIVLLSHQVKFFYAYFNYRDRIIHIERAWSKNLLINMVDAKLGHFRKGPKRFLFSKQFFLFSWNLK